jgi:hypothetical protein
VTVAVHDSDAPTVPGDGEQVTVVVVEDSIARVVVAEPPPLNVAVMV